jgi:hypothetical protein
LRSVFDAGVLHPRKPAASELTKMVGRTRHTLPIRIG